MKRRLTLRSDGTLVDKDGAIYGTLVSLTLDLHLDSAAELGGEGGVGEASPLASTQRQNKGRHSEDPPQDGVVGEGENITARVWRHYQTVIPSGKQYILELKRRTMIRNALKVRPLSQVLLAIDGLAQSPHHNGQNDRRKKYLGIQYALKGIGAEGNDERIDKMAAIATTVDVLAHIPSAGRDMVRTRQRQVEDMLLHPGDANRAARGGGSARYLVEQFGLAASVENDRIVWHRTGVRS